MTKLAALIDQRTIDDINSRASEPDSIKGIIQRIIFGNPSTASPSTGIFPTILTIIFFLVLAYGVYGAILYFTSYGNEEKIKKGKMTMIWAIAGAVLVAGSFVIVRYVAGKILGINENYFDILQ